MVGARFASAQWRSAQRRSARQRRGEAVVQNRRRAASPASYARRPLDILDLCNLTISRRRRWNTVSQTGLMQRRGRCTGGWFILLIRQQRRFRGYLPARDRSRHTGQILAIPDTSGALIPLSSVTPSNWRITEIGSELTGCFFFAGYFCSFYIFRAFEN